MTQAFQINDICVIYIEIFTKYMYYVAVPVKLALVAQVSIRLCVMVLWFVL